MGADNCDRGVNDGVVDDEEVVESDYDDIGLDGNKPSVVERRPFYDDIGLDGNKPSIVERRPFLDHTNPPPKKAEPWYRIIGFQFV